MSKATAGGAGAVASASGSASHPDQIVVSIVATPSQRIVGGWSIACSNGFQAGSKSGQIAAATPLIRTFTFGTTRPDRCTAHATAQLSRDGQLTVQIAHS